ncbi:hypothetical protein MRX96_010938 [Rhipicephalus microplus]
MPEWLVLRHRPRNVTSTLRTSSSLRHPPRMLSAEDALVPGDAREAAPDPGVVVPPRDVPAHAPGRKNVPGEIPLLSLAPTQSRGTFRGGPTRSRSRTPTTSNSKKPTLSWADKARGRREATNQIAVLPARVSSTRCDELTSS